MTALGYSNYPAGVWLLPGEEPEDPGACANCGEPGTHYSDDLRRFCDRCLGNLEVQRDNADVAALVAKVWQYAMLNGYPPSLTSALAPFPGGRMRLTDDRSKAALLILHAAAIRAVNAGIANFADVDAAALALGDSLDELTRRRDAERRPLSGVN
jgi:hypothetical protein